MHGLPRNGLWVAGPVGTQSAFTLTIAGYLVASITALVLPAGVTLTDHGDRTATIAAYPGASPGVRGVRRNAPQRTHRGDGLDTGRPGLLAGGQPRRHLRLRGRHLPRLGCRCRPAGPGGGHHRDVDGAGYWKRRGTPTPTAMRCDAMRWGAMGCDAMGSGSIGGYRMTAPPVAIAVPTARSEPAIRRHGACGRPYPPASSPSNSARVVRPSHGPTRRRSSGDRLSRKA